jgi:hypothetical protein
MGSAAHCNSAADRGDRLVKAAARRRKGARVEAEIVARHKALGVHAERYPLSGGSRFRGSSHDVDVYLFGRGAAPLVCEVKARKSGAGFAQLESWLGEYDCLFYAATMPTRWSVCHGGSGRVLLHG